MSNLRPKQTKIMLGDKEYGMLFNLNAIDEIQDRFDIPISEIDKLVENERNAFKAIKAILAILINEAIDDAESGEAHVTEVFVGRKIAASDITSAKSDIFSAFVGSIPEASEEGGDEDPTKGEQ